MDRLSPRRPFAWPPPALMARFASGIGSGHERYPLTGHKGPVARSPFLRTASSSPAEDAIRPRGCNQAFGGRDHGTPGRKDQTAGKRDRRQPLPASLAGSGTLHPPGRTKSRTAGDPDPDGDQQREGSAVPVPGQDQKRRSRSERPPVLSGKTRPRPERRTISVTLPLPADRPDGTIPLSL